MKIARLLHNNRPRWAMILDSGNTYRVFETDKPWEEQVFDGKSYPVRPENLLAPAVPSKIVAVGLNYKDHVKEMAHEEHKEPVIFLKPSSALLNPEGTILYPSASQRVDYEAELAVVLKARLKDASPEEALKAVWGFTCCNDVTARDLQKTDGQWARAKGFDSFCPLGPWLVTDFVEKDQKILGRVNGVVKQSAKISQRIWGTAQLLSFVSKVMTLEPLDVLTTGTPSGIGPLQPGDLVEVEVEGIGILKNNVQKR
ncbi:MAG TPA: fumarylacetoacetate hydrolase family protein [bacterium]|nr:fumarylacetoacetate hydrolase family protein [bacterium]